LEVNSLKILTDLFEMDGASKGFDRIKGIKNSFLVMDNTETGFGNKIPLWLFGLI